MTISEKIYHFMKINDITVKEFSEKIGIARVTLSAMLNGRNRFSQDFFESLNKNFKEIDLNALVDENIDTEYIIKNNTTPEQNRIKELEKALRDIKKIASNL